MGSPDKNCNSILCNGNSGHDDNDQEEQQEIVEDLKRKKTWSPVSGSPFVFGIVIANFIPEDEEELSSSDRRSSTPSLYLRLLIGDAVVIYKELGAWFCGIKLSSLEFSPSTPTSKPSPGIFPKSFVTLKEAVVHRIGALESIELKQDPLVREITRILKDWSFLVKESYVKGSFIVYDSVSVLIHELIDLRKEILSETLSLDSLKQIKQEVARKIEQGNALLGLDIIVRDDTGNLLMPDETSTIDLFRAHESAVKRIRLFHQQTLNKQYQLQKQSKQISIQQQKNSQSAPRGLSFIGDRTSSLSTLSGDSGNNNGNRMQTSLHVCVHNFNSRMADDAELLISLFDARKFKFISENFLIKINNRSSEERNETNFNVVFTDLGSEDLERDKILLVCQVIRVGCMEMKAETGGGGNMSPSPGGHTPDGGGSGAFGSRGLRASMNPSKRLTDGIRRPFGVGVSDITDIVKEKVSLEEDAQLFVSITTCGERDSLESVLRKVVSNAKLSGVTPSSISNISISLPSSPVLRQQLNGIGVWTSVKVLHGEDACIDLNSSTLVCLRSDSPVNPSLFSQSQVARKIGFPDIILPGDVRNDLYLTLISSNFSSKSSASSGSKNIEVSARVCNEKGSVVAGVVSAGGVSSPLVTEYHSVVYHHDMEPKWNETIRVTIPIEEFYGSHVQFLFRHRSSIDTKDKNERPFAFAFIRLGNLNGTAISDSRYECLVYKIDKKFDVSADASYLRLPATKAEMEERSTLPAAVNFVSNTNIRPPSPKTPSSPRSSSSFLKADLFQRKVSVVSDSSSQSASSSLTPAINGTAPSYLPPLPPLTNQKAITSYCSQMCPGLSLQLKDSFSISTVICSTKLTQNFDLMALLAIDLENTSDDDIKKCLKLFLDVDGEEIVKFLQDSLDALFKIFVVKEEAEINSLFFECLIRILSLISDTKYCNFKPVLDSYIADTFSWTLAYNKLIMELKGNIIRMILLDPAASSKATPVSDMRYFSRNDGDQIMDSLEYLFKFIARSRSLHSSIEGGKGRKSFENSMRDLFVHFSQLMSVERENVFKLQSKFLRNFPKIIPDLIMVFDPEELSHALASLLTIIPVEKLKTHKIAYILDVIHMDILFKQGLCRKQLLPPMTDHLRVFMEKKDPVLMGSCIEVLSEVLRILHGYEAVVTGSTKFDAQEVMFSCLKTVMDSIIHYFATPTTPVGTLTHASFYLSSGTNDSQILRSLVSVLISLLRQMTPFHFQSYFGHFKSDDDLMDFLIQILMVFQNLISHPVFPTDCIDMILHECQVMLTSLKHVSRCIKEFSQKRFEFQLWNNYFHCAISFLTQPLLQLESFGNNKRNTIISKFGDMRREAAIEVRSMWYNLGSNKVKFVPGIVGPFVEMTLIPDSGLRKDTIPIFFDMMHSELLNPVPDPSGNGFRSKGNFKEFEKEMITQLDKLVEGGKGDQEYKEMLFEILGSLWETHQYRKQGLEFCKTISRLMKRLLEYRQVQSRSPSSTLSNAVHAEENKENRMLCIVNILEFYSEIHRQEMYLRYLYKLLDLHIQSENWIEAGYTLFQYTTLLNWSEDPLPSCLKPSDSFPLFLINPSSYDLRTLDTHRQLKQRLYENIIDFFDRGKLWEEGIRLCRELAYLFEKELYDYTAMSTLLLKMSTLYKNIMTEFRPEPEYFRVSFFGRGFPSSIQNKTFICRGKEYEQLISFQSRLSNQFPTATMMKTLTPPDADITESDGQFILATKVDPIMHVKRDFEKKCVAEQIVNYYRVNDIQTFSFSRPLRKSSNNSSDRDSENEFANIWIERTTFKITYPLPGIVRLFPVTHFEKTELSPLQNAIESVASTNNDIKSLVLQQLTDPMTPLNSLSLKLKGVIDAAVNGGLINYEKAFFCESYEQDNPGDREALLKLRNLIAEQVPLLEVGLSIENDKVSRELKPLHDHLEVQFKLMKNSLESKYGRKETPQDLKDAMENKRKTDSIFSLYSSQNQLSSQETPSKQHYRSNSIWRSPNSISSVGWGTTISRLTRSSKSDGNSHRSSQEKTKRKESSLWYTDTEEGDADNSEPSRESGIPAASSISNINEDSMSRGVSMSSLSTLATISSLAASTQTISSSNHPTVLQPVIELDQCLIPQRPWRPEFEKNRNNRPASRTEDSPLTSNSTEQIVNRFSRDQDSLPPQLPPKSGHSSTVLDLTSSTVTSSPETGFSSVPRTQKRISSGKSLPPLPPSPSSPTEQMKESRQVKSIPPPVAPRKSKSSFTPVNNYSNNSHPQEDHLYKQINCLLPNQTS